MLRLADELNPVGRLIGPPPFVVVGPFERRTVKLAMDFSFLFYNYLQTEVADLK
jgi:hypothetical protein